ncbi:hypothetical protein [Polaribacter sp. Hel_I_88]|uniref:hypothetical protein n=1 Tax=Polaribacter sp. Hel_I_88 TaxID=1250006 RepID=UPI00047D613D|nr:hypothetical protein [Polaribacter sp. Hel_I_88]
MKIIVSIIISLCVLSTLNAQKNVEISDFEILNNTNWKGILLYKNYSDGKEVTLQTTMTISLKKNKVITEIKFTGEPKANSKNIVKLRKKGTYFGNEKVIRKEILKNGFTKIITFYRGKDNSKKAKMYNTYLFNKDSFSITKEVEYLDSKGRFIRNKQTYTRI